MECPDCGYGYAARDARDRKRHRDFHDKEQNGVLAPLIDSEHIIWRGEPPTLEMLLNDDIPNPCIIALTPRSPFKLRKVASQASTFANLETGFTGGVYHHTEPPDPERDRHLFLYGQYGRFVGLVVFDRRTRVNKLTWEEHDRRARRPWSNAAPFRGPWAKTAPFWGLSFLWIHRNHRRKGLATRLLTVGVDHLGTRLDHIGVSLPLSESAESLARALSPDGVRFAS